MNIFWESLEISLFFCVKNILNFFLSLKIHVSFKKQRGGIGDLLYIITLVRWEKNASDKNFEKRKFLTGWEKREGLKIKGFSLLQEGLIRGRQMDLSWWKDLFLGYVALPKVQSFCDKTLYSKLSQCWM